MTLTFCVGNEFLCNNRYNINRLMMLYTPQKSNGLGPQSPVRASGRELLMTRAEPLRNGLLNCDAFARADCRAISGGKYFVAALVPFSRKCARATAASFSFDSPLSSTDILLKSTYYTHPASSSTICTRSQAQPQ
jgi:hypothetical protein